MTGSEPTDAELLRAHADGEPGAFELLVRRHQQRMWAVALRTLHDPDEAADALQDALISAHRGAGAFRGESAVSTWLHRIVVNACLDRVRRRQARPTVELPETGPREPADPRDRIAERDSSLQLEAVLGMLSVEQRAAIVLVDIEGYPVAEAAQLLGVAEGTVKSRCARGRARLAALLRPAGNDGDLSSVSTTARVDGTQLEGEVR